MLRPLVFLLLTFSSLPQSAAVTKDEPPAPYVDADAYEVYSTILPSEWPLRVANAKTLVIMSATKGYQMCLSPEKESEKVIGTAISDYVKLNEKTWLLQRKFSLETPYTTLGSDELKAALERGGWDGFYKQHPNSGGWIELSAVGFNADKTAAVVYMGHSCGMLCGGGGFHVLRKKEAKWIPLEWKGRACGWAS
ncbi:MAG TPA: hypothetical protein VM864_09045 [Pyrinomonadaceae bacterium]|jgi:hypothetical protein|nr:hypothetical protein [Pyrinomonadaceae bacterium]